MKRYQLMIPGPVPVDPEILQVLAQPPVAHYGDQWTCFYQESLKALKEVLQTKGEVFLLVGSGSAGLDALIGSLLGRSGKALVLANGAFGERLYEIARSHTDNAEIVRVPAGKAIGPALLQGALQQHPVDAVFVTHCETSTGVLNPVEQLSDVCKEHNCLLVVDAISSLGGVPLPIDEWDLAACVTASQKCLEIPPGLAVVSVSPKAWKLIEQSDVRGWYLNLRTWKDYSTRWQDWHPYPVTMPTGLVEALRKSLERMMAEGLPSRFQRHAEVAAFLRQGLRNLGLEILAPEEFASPTVTAVATGGRFSVETLQRFLMTEYNILIAEGSGELRGKTFRIGHMGPSARKQHIVPLLFGIEKALQSQGIAIKDGQAFIGL